MDNAPDLFRQFKIVAFPVERSLQELPLFYEPILTLGAAPRLPGKLNRPVQTMVVVRTEDVSLSSVRDRVDFLEHKDNPSRRCWLLG